METFCGHWAAAKVDLQQRDICCGLNQIFSALCTQVQIIVCNLSREMQQKHKSSKFSDAFCCLGFFEGETGFAACSALNLYYCG